jgi:hypothetical protein
MNEMSTITTSNRNSQSTSAELGIYSGDNEWEPASSMKKQPLSNITSKYNW